MGQINFTTTPHNSGLGDPLATAFEAQQSMNTELYDTVVFEVPGLGLSEANFTNADKAKLDAIMLPIAPQVQADAAETNPLAISYIQNQKTNLSEFVNDGDGVNPFVTDIDSPGNYIRTENGWELATSIGVDSIDFAPLVAPQQNFIMPAGSVAIKAEVNGTPYYKETLNNLTYLFTFTQASPGSDVIFKDPLEINNYPVIFYKS